MNLNGTYIIERESLMVEVPVRVLHVLGAMDRGGVETMLMNYYRHIDRKKIQFDFLTMIPGNHPYDDEVRELGGRIFIISPPRKSNPLRHIKDIIRIIRQKGPFIAVHAHTQHHTGLVALAARMAGVKIRICHSHNTSDVNNNLLWRKIYFRIMKMLINSNATCMLACGEMAGRYLFGNKNFDSGKVQILPNAIDTKIYSSLNKDKALNMRKKFGIPSDTLIIGHVGRFTQQKNHKFFIPLMKKMISIDKKVLLILVGDGKLRSSFEKEVKENGLNEYVKCLGVRSDIPDLMNMFDVLVFPSLYEGLPVTLVEAQAAGTPCVVSSTVTTEVDMGLNLIKFLDLNSDYKIWCETIIQCLYIKKPEKSLIMEQLKNKGYDINSSVEKLLKIYMS